jgi:hypothetical protein
MIVLLILLTGIVFFPIASETNLTRVPQLAWFIFSGGTMMSFLLHKRNKLAAILLFIVMAQFLRAILVVNVPKVFLYEALMFSLATALVYHAARTSVISEKILKWFLFPALINIIFIFIQKFIPQVLPLKGFDVCGMLGNAGFSAMFLGLTTPLFIRYFKIGIPFLLAAILFCEGFVGTLIFISCFIPFMKDRRLRTVLCFTMIAVGFIIFFRYNDQFMIRISMLVGSLDGIMHHPFLGWGMGTFVPVISKIPEAESVYFGVPFNSNYIMNHPTSEFLFGWWNFGLPFFIGMIIYTFDVLRKILRGSGVLPSILLGGIISMTFSSFTPPSIFLVALTLGMYEKSIGGQNG